MSPFLLTGDALREPWRLVTCHVVHWGWDHALRNGIAMLIPFALVGRKRHLAAVLVCLAPLLSLTLLPVLQGGVYGGMSGLACAAWAFTGTVRAARDARAWPGLALCGLLGVKVVLERTTGALLPGSEGNWQSLAEAHVSGALLGLVAGLVEVASAARVSGWGRGGWLAGRALGLGPDPDGSPRSKAR